MDYNGKALPVHARLQADVFLPGALPTAAQCGVGICYQPGHVGPKHLSCSVFFLSCFTSCCPWDVFAAARVMQVFRGLVRMRGQFSQ